MRSLILSQCSNLRMGLNRSFNHSTCKAVLNLLEAVYLRFKKIVHTHIRLIITYDTPHSGTVIPVYAVTLRNSSVSRYRII